MLATAIIEMISGWPREHGQTCAANKTETSFQHSFFQHRWTSTNSPTSKIIKANHHESLKQIIINHHTFMSNHHLQHLDSPPIQRKQTYLSYLQCVSSLGSTSAPPCFEVGHPAALPGPLSKALRTMRCNSNSWQSSKLVFKEWDGWFCKESGLKKQKTGWGDMFSHYQLIHL